MHVHMCTQKVSECSLNDVDVLAEAPPVVKNTISIIC